MIKVTFTKPVETLRSTTELYQWDTGQSLEIGGLGDCGTPDIHFTFHGMKFAYVTKSESVGGKLYVEIPNKILMYGKDIIVYICTEVNGVKSTLASVIIPVIKRNMPADYFYNAEDDELATVDRLLAETERATEVEANHEQRISDIETNHGQRITDLESYRSTNTQQLETLTTENAEQHNEFRSQISAIKNNVESLSTDYGSFKTTTEESLSSEIATREILSNQVGTMSTALDDVTAEVAQARVDFDGNGHNTLKVRLDAGFNELNDKIIGDAEQYFDTTKNDIEELVEKLTTPWTNAYFTLVNYKDFQGVEVKTISFVGAVGNIDVALIDCSTVEEITENTAFDVVKKITVNETGYQTHEINVFVPKNKILALRTANKAACYGAFKTTGQDFYMISRSPTITVDHKETLTLGLGFEYYNFSAVGDCEKKISGILQTIDNNVLKYEKPLPKDYENKLSKVLYPVMSDVQASTGWTDLPNGVPNGVIVNVRGSKDAILQMLYNYNNNKEQIYQRVIKANYEGAWKMVGSCDVDKIKDKADSSEVVVYEKLSPKDYENKLSKVLKPFMCNVQASTGWTDLPNGVPNGVILNVKGYSGIYLQMCFHYAKQKVYYRVIKSESDGTWKEFMPTLLSTSPTIGKKCGCLGDSITYGLKGTSWTTKLNEYCGFAETINYGVSGSCIRSNGNNGFLDRYTTMAEDLDYVVVWGGVNDFMWTTQTKEAFKANYESLIVGLLNRYPSAKFLAITPMKFDYTEKAQGAQSGRYDVAKPNGTVLKDYRDAEIEVLEKYSMPYLDFFNCSGISPESEAQASVYFAGEGDNLHPNTYGNLQILAPKIAEALKRL